MSKYKLTDEQAKSRPRVLAWEIYKNTAVETTLIAVVSGLHICFTCNGLGVIPFKYCQLLQENNEKDT